MNGAIAMLREPGETRAAPPFLGVPAYFPGPLREASRTIEVAAGDYLFHQGAVASACYRVVRGIVRLEKVSPGGTAATLQHAGAGDWLREPNPYDDLHGSSAAAVAPSLVLAVSARQFRTELHRNISFTSAWGLEAAETARRLQRKVERLVLPARDRVLHYLVTEDMGTGADGCEIGSMHEWAEQLGIAAETLSRAVSDLRNEGCIESQGHMFRLIAKPGGSQAFERNPIDHGKH